MHGIEEAQQLLHECGRSQREIARARGLSADTVNQLQLRKSLPEPSRASLSAARFSMNMHSRGYGGTGTLRQARERGIRSA